MNERKRFRILSRDSFTCQYCGLKAPAVELHVDHVIARANGGTDEDANLITACVKCNTGKGSLEVAVECVVGPETQITRLDPEKTRRRKTEWPEPWLLEHLTHSIQYWIDEKLWCALWVYERSIPTATEPIRLQIKDRDFEQDFLPNQFYLHFLSSRQDRPLDLLEPFAWDIFRRLTHNQEFIVAGPGKNVVIVEETEDNGATDETLGTIRTSQDDPPETSGRSPS